MTLLCVFLITLIYIQQIRCAEVTSEVDLDIFPSLSSKSCSDFGSNYIYDSTSYRCTQCPQNQTADSTSVDAQGNPTDCTCVAGYAKKMRETSCIGITDGTCASFTCYSCYDQNLISYSDRSGCGRCGNQTLGMESTSTGLTGYCACPTNYALVEEDTVGNKLVNLTCVACPQGTQVIYFDTTIAGRKYTANRYTCQACPDPNMQMSYSNNIYTCLCKSGYTITGVASIGELSCLENSVVQPFLSTLPTASIIRYSSAGQSINSLTIQHYYLSAAVRCTYLSTPSDVRYCQILSNLCALFEFDYETTVCLTYLRAIQGRGMNYTNNIENWKFRLPWVWYSTIQISPVNGDYSFTAFCEQRGIYEHPVSLNKDFLQYILARYAINGSFLGFMPLETSFQYCQQLAPNSGDGGGTSSNTRWQYFAYTNTLTYSCDLSLLLDSPQYFYELFLYDKQTSKYLPVPVRVTDSRPAGGSKLCDNGVLVRRFMLYDVVSGIAQANELPTVISFASYISIQTKMVPETDNEIYPPVATIIYTEVDTTTLSDTTLRNRRRLVTNSNKMINTKENDSTKLAVNQLLTNLRSYFHQQRLSEDRSDMSTHTRRLQSSSSSNTQAFIIDVQYFHDGEIYKDFELIFLIIAVILSMIMFYFRFNNWRIRHGRTIQVSALTSDIAGVNYENMRILLMVAMNSYVRVVFLFITLISWYFFVFFKLQSVASVLPPYQDDNQLKESSYYYQFVVQVHICAILQVVYIFHNLIAMQSKSDIFFIDWEPAKTKNSKDSHQVSVWRTILVANEYAEMLTKRRSDVRFSLFFLGFFLIYLNLQNNATQQPSLQDLSDGKINTILRYANNTWFWFVVSAIQYVWKYLIYERYISEPPEQIFVDFCTIAKISIFILDEKFHGYYLHCRSPHPYADGTMIELIDMLHKEEAGMTVDRALDDGPPFVQTFECYLSTEWRVEYDKINNSLIIPQNLNEIIDQRRRLAVQRQQNSQPDGQGGILWNYSNLRQGPRELSHRLRRESNTNQALGIFGFAWSNLPSEKVLKAWSEMMHFLRDFVENNFAQAGLKRVIKEPSYHERLLHMGPNLVVPGQPSVMVADRDYSFTKTMFLGQELDLLMNDILLFNLFCIWFDSIMLAIFLVYLVDEFLLKRFKQGWGEDAVHIMAGTFILVSLALYYWVSEGFLIVVAFVGANLFQYGFTGFCPAALIFGFMGLPDATCAIRDVKPVVYASESKSPA